MNRLVLETTDQGEVAVDVYQRLSKDRILFLCGEITDQLASAVIATLLLRDHENQEQKITIFINSVECSLRNALMLYDTIQLLQAPIETVCFGLCSTPTTLLLVGGSKGMRLATKHAIIHAGQLTHEWETHTNLPNAQQLRFR